MRQPIDPKCAASPTGHVFRPGSQLSRWELVFYCEKCATVVRTDASDWYNNAPATPILGRAFRETSVKNA